MSLVKTSFLKQSDTITLAKSLLGKELIHETEEGITSGIIVETEAYLFNDKACHAYHRRTANNEAMFGKAGTVYVYKIYGIYHCFNIVSNIESVGEAVLIRALEPLEGIDLMQKRRRNYKYTNTKNTFSNKELCSGPSKLAIAMGFKKEDSFKEINKSNIYLKEANYESKNIITTTRIGITTGNDEHLPYRYYIKDNVYISKK